MNRIAMLLVGLIAALHFYIAWFEIFAWTTRGPEVFSTLPMNLFEPTQSMAANQGLYNAFLAAGLSWSLFIRNAEWRFKVATCFLSFVAVAGIFGAVTVSQKIIVVQTVPATIALIFVYLGYRQTARAA
ncbi:DUF1304 domain-containing protein [Parasphingorhabdus cellanae]|uniref:DUF1304 domain-containing protein n=1 Tax=Parasphingorhabdus cellanae TaxID=2806553 RepID=A0ABX7T6D4_9SPHN|nr:DUF1304 domain-containing protein [Parasphingorhabdus cellanae]QTD57171.1 DUF1304 domain-containing protein [Parasphingorhabdus cellanae]